MSLKKHRHACPWLCGATVCLAMLVSSERSGAELPPVRIWGELGYDFRVEDFEGGNDTLEHAAIARLNGATYLYQPWIATVEGGVGFDVRRADRDSGDIESENIIGHGRLRLLPQSRFPFEAYGERTDSRSDTDLAGQDLERTRVGLQQRYSTLGGTAYNLRYEHTDQTSNTRSSTGVPEQHNDVADLVQFSFDKAVAAHGIHFNSQVNVIERDNSQDRKTETLFSSLRHTYNPSPVLSAEDMLTYNSTRAERALDDVKTDILQLHSFGYWRPKTRRPLRINATLRALERTSEIGATEGSIQSATGTLGATYQWSPRWLFSGSAGATGIEGDTDSEVLTFQTATANYTSEQARLGGFDAGWFAQADLRNNTDDQGSIQSVGGLTGYNLSRSMSAGRAATVLFNASQSVSAVTETDDFNSQRLLSQLSLSWHDRGRETTRMLRASLSDSRTWASGSRAGEVEGDFQLANLQASLDHRLTTTSSLSGNLTVQATRRSTGDATTLIANDGEWIPTATADITYFDRLVFGVPRLTFRSTLRFISDSYLPLLDEPDDLDGREDMRWDNRLEYTIGRLQLRATGRVSEIRGEQQMFFLFQVRRLFGDI